MKMETKLPQNKVELKCKECNKDIDKCCFCKKIFMKNEGVFCIRIAHLCSVNCICKHFNIKDSEAIKK